MHLDRHVTLLLALGPLAACGGGGSGGGGGEPDPDPPTVEFAADDTSVSESAGSIELALVLSDPSGEPVLVPFTVTGSAEAGVDYELASASPLEIPAGAEGAAIELTLLDDDIAFGPLAIEIELGEPTGAELGQALVHAIALIDDEVPLPELEPNDNLSLAAQNGPLADLTPGSVISIGGSVAMDDDLFDVHRLQVVATSDVVLGATLVGPHPELLVALTNAQGIPFGDRLDPDAVSFQVPAGRYYVVIQSTGAATAYQVRLEVAAAP